MTFATVSRVPAIVTFNYLILFHYIYIAFTMPEDAVVQVKIAISPILDDG